MNRPGRSSCSKRAGAEPTIRGAHDLRVRRPDDLRVLVGIVEAAQHVAHGLKQGALLSFPLMTVVSPRPEPQHSRIHPIKIVSPMINAY
jgi:hypothetical protein